MNKFFSLLKAVMSQDMQVFRYKAKANSSSSTKISVTIFLAMLVMFSIGTFYFSIAIELNKANLLFVLLELAIAFPSLLAVMEGNYKSQGILFEAKDNELLFSLPISKKYILAVKIIKLYVFQLLYSLLFSVPGIIVYVLFENPTAYFYFITAIMLVLFPIIPTIIGSVIGFLIKQISVKFKAKKVVQLLITFCFIFILMATSFKSDSIIEGIVDRADTVDTTIRNAYYPISAYIDLINEFDVFKFILLISINALFVMLFLIFTSKKYFSVLSKSKDNTNSLSKRINVVDFSYKKNNVITALLKKEFSRFFSSTVYMVNTLFGLLLLIISTVALCLNFDQAIEYIASGNISTEDVAVLHMLAPKVFLVVVIGLSFLTSITSSSISLEGKTFNISKSLPVKENKMLLAKVLMSDIITIPVILVCDLIFIFNFKVELLDTLSILLASFIAPSIAAVFGLIVNLKFPNMNASSDAEVVKQSTSSMVAVFGGIFLAGIFVAITFVLAAFGGIGMIIEVGILAFILFILWILLIKYGRKRYREIEA